MNKYLDYFNLKIPLHLFSSSLQVIDSVDKMLPQLVKFLRNVNISYNFKYIFSNDLDMCDLKIGCDDHICKLKRAFF